MRCSSSLRLILALGLAAGLSTAAASQTRPAAKAPATKAASAKTPPAKAAPEPPPHPPADPSKQIKTADQIKRESVQGAATAPLRDLNMVKAKIPPILLIALEDPYARPPAKWRCAQMIDLVRPLDEALGPDIDRVLPGDENLMDRSKSTALGAAADFASDAIPFRGWVRKLSGAEAHDKLVQSAIIAGNVRRAYLKGLGEAKGCNPPATPSHERAAVRTVVAEEKKERLTPRYPTRQPAAQKTPAGTSPAAAPRPRT